MYTRDANIILLVYDISNKDTFNHLPDWIRDLTNVNIKEVIFVIVANKIDLNAQRAVTLEEGQKFAEEHDFLFQEISAKTGVGFSELFYKKLFEKIRTKFSPGGQQSSTDVNDIKFNIDQDGTKNVSKKKCC